MHRPSLRDDFAWAALGALAAVALAATALLNRADFFLHDDYRTYFIPMFGEVSRLVRSGEFPLLTDRVWNGGAILAEYQLGVLNPVNLTLMAWVGQMTDLAAAAAAFALAHIALFASGTFVLCRGLGCRRDIAFLIALIAPTSEWIFYWGAGDWIPALTSIAWAPWAWAGLLAASRDPRWTPAAAAGIATLLLSGWPFADLALLVSIGVARVATGGRLPRGAVLAVLCGGLLAAPAILPLAAYLHGSDRPVGPLFTSNLEALVGVSTPFMVTQWVVFGGVRETVVMPMLQIAWFVAPALAAAAWRDLWRRAEVRALALIVAAFAALAVMPGLWQFRWMFRVLPYYQLAVALLAALALDDTLRSGRKWRLLAVALALGPPLWIALWQDERMNTFYFVIAAALLLLAGAALCVQPRRAGAFVATLAVGHVALFVLVNTAYVGFGRYTGERPLPTRKTVSSEPSLTRYMLFQFDGRPATWTDFRPAQTSLERPGSTINSYSPFTRAAYAKALCLDAFGASTCADAAERLTRPLIGAGAPILDLARVDEVRAQGPHVAAFATRRPDWPARALSDGDVAFRRPDPFSLPAPVAVAPADARLGGVRASPARVSLTVNTRAGGRLILARAWYPGWRATLNGRPLLLHPVADLFVATDLPPNSAGTLAFSYWPKGLTLGLAAASVGLLLLAAGTAVLVRRAKNVAPAGGAAQVADFAP